MKFAATVKYHSNTVFDTYEMPDGNGDSRLTPLILDELQKLIALELEPGSKLDKVRDLFIFGCLTGQRFQDLVSLKFNDLTKDANGEYANWKLYQSKGNKAEAIFIPLIHPEIKKILSKRLQYADGTGNVFNKISNQKANEYIKEVAKLANLNRNVPLVRYSGKEQVKTNQLIYDMISFHWARATFITLSIEFGMNQHAIIKLSGHTTVNTLKHYIKLTKDQVQDNYSNSGWMK
jgi:integrase